MVDAEARWTRWCGTRTDLMAAIKLGCDLVHETTGLPTEVEVSVSLKNGIRDKQEGLEPLENLHRHELGEVDSIRADVRVSWDAWHAAREAAREAGTDDVPRPEEAISIAISDSVGVSLEVQAADKTRAAGLRTRMAQALQPGASNLPPFDRFWFFLVGVALVTALTIVVRPLVRALGWAEQDGQVEVAEAIGLAAAVSIGVGIAYAAWWMFPPTEVLDDAEVGRFRRFRGRFLLALVTLVLAVLGAFVYDAIRA